MVAPARMAGSGTGGCGSGVPEAESAADGGRWSATGPRGDWSLRRGGRRPVTGLLGECCHGQGGGSGRRRLDPGAEVRRRWLAQQRAARGKEMRRPRWLAQADLGGRGGSGQVRLREEEGQ